MSDEFDKRQPADDGQDDDLFNWSDETPESGGSPAAGGLGVTGDLPWRRDVRAAFGDTAEESGDEAFDWQRSPQAGDSGAAENDPLDWLAAFDPSELSPAAGFDDAPQDEPLPEPDLEDLFAGIGALTGAPAPAAADDLPPWLADIGAAADQPPTQAESGFDAPPLAAYQPAQPASADLPPWLADLGMAESEPQAAAEPDLDAPPLAAYDAAPADDVPPWLADIGADEPQTFEMPPAAPADDLFAEFEPEAAAPADDLFAEFEPEAAAPADDLFAEFEPEAAAPADDLFAEFEPEAAAPADDLFAEFEPEAEPPAPIGLEPFMEEMPAEPGAAEPAADDLFALFDEPAAAAEPAVDALFAEFGVGAAVESFEAPEEPAADDLFAAFDNLTPEAEPTAPAPPGDIFGELGLPSPETGYDFLDQPEQADWFAEQPADAIPNWLDELGELDVAQFEAADEQFEREAAPVEDDMLADLRAVSGQWDDEPSTPEPEVPALQDIDSLLASLGEPEAPRPAPRRGFAEDGPLLSEAELNEIAARRAAAAAEDEPLLTPDAPDWLTELGVSVGVVSAAAILRRQAEQERPVEELSDRLQALRERSIDLPAPVEAAPPPSLKTLLPGISQFIPAAPVQIDAIGTADDVVLTDAQRDKLRLLRGLTGQDSDEARPLPPSAIDLTLTAPGLADVAAEGEEAAADEFALTEAEVKPAPARRRRRLQADRLVVTLLLAVAVILPFFVPELRLGSLPPGAFAPDSGEAAFYDRLERLPRGALALVAAEYGPTGAGELDGFTDAVLRHLIGRGVRPVLVSGSPLGALHVKNIADRLVDDAAFTASLGGSPVANRDFYVVRYLAGSVIGVRAFAQNVGAYLGSDISGQPTGLNTRSLDDFAAIVVIAERAEDLRAWAEQVAPLAGQPLLAAVSYSAAPLAEPYVMADSPQRLSGLEALLVGYADAYTYRAMLDSAAPLPLAAPPTEMPPPTEVPPDAAGEPAGEAEATPEVIPTSIVPSATVSAPTDAPTAAATAAQTVEPGVVVTGIITSTEAINMREGPGRTFAPVTAVAAGARVQIIGRDGLGQWLQVRLTDGREGWVLAALVRIEEPPTPDGPTATPFPVTGTPTPRASQPDPNALVALISDRVLLPARQDAPEATAEAAAETAAPLDAPDEPAVAADSPPPAAPSAYRDERWYGMTLGLIVIIGLIALGALGSSLSAVLRRGRR